MKLVYKILWIDNEQDFFQNHEDIINEYLEDKGFVCDITKYTSISEFEDKEISSEHQKSYDLFLIDLNLDNDDTGDQIINNIRENTLVDIIFYSTVLDSVRKSVSKNNIEGVYITNRNKYDFEEKVTDVIDVTIRKVQDVNNLRGLIMAEVSELDRIKTDIIKKFTQNNSNHNDLKKYIRGDFCITHNSPP
jgi:CheY-like chemotaxis protein